MSATPFVIPEGLVLTQEAGGLRVEHAGTIELHATLGGPIAALVSTGGDVVLHLPLEVERIEAAGAVRAAADLEVRSLAADTVEAAGELRADTLRSRGEVRVEGELRAGAVEATGLRCAGLQASALQAEGKVEVAGDARVERVQAAELAVGGALQVQELVAGGAVAVLGSLDGQQVKAGNLSVGGDLAVQRLHVDGDAGIEGALDADEVGAAGSLSTGGALRATSVEVGADLSTGGALHAERIAVLGKLSTGGDVQARDLQAASLAVGGGLQVAERLHTDGRLEISGDVATTELSAGELVLGGKVIATRVRAADRLVTRGEVHADRLQGREVVLEGGNVRVKVVQGTELVRIGAAAVHCDLVIAPRVVLDPAATGRISVLESQSEVGPSKIKGCLSLEDLDDLFGNAEQFLADRGVSRLGEPVGADNALSTLEIEVEDSVSILPEDDSAPLGAAAADAVDEEPLLEPEGAGQHDEDVADEVTRPEGSLPPQAVEVEQEVEASEAVEVDVDGDGQADADVRDDADAVEISVQLDGEAPAAEALAEQEAAPAAATSAGDEDLFGWADQMLTEVVSHDAIHHPDAEPETGGVAAVRVDEEPAAPSAEAASQQVADLLEELEELEELEPEQPEDPIHGQMQDTINRIVTCYVHSEMPPAVSRLKDLVDARDYTRIRADITDIWNQLLKFHQKRGMRIQPQVTTTFNTINSLVRKL